MEKKYDWVEKWYSSYFCYCWDIDLMDLDKIK